MSNMTAQEARVLLVDHHGIVRDIVTRTLDEAAGVALVGVVEGATDLVRAVADTRATAVVWAVPEHGPEHGFDLLRAHPGLKLLLVERDGRRSVLWEMRPRGHELGELSPERLVAAIVGTVDA